MSAADVVDGALENIAQSLREGHCARGDAADHPCVGVVTITRDGVKLACASCGSGAIPIAPAAHADEVKVAQAVLGAVGLDWNDLNPQVQRRVFEIVKRTDLLRRRGMP